MKTTYQHKFIAQHLKSSYGHLEGWPSCTVSEIEAELCRHGLSLTAGNYLVVHFACSGVHCETISDFAGLAAFPSNSLVIPFHDLERAFHEQYADYVEL